MTKLADRHNGSDEGLEASQTKLEPPKRYIARQPILDVNLNLYGYELLYRSGPVNAFSGDGEEATRHVIDSYLSLIPESSQGFAFVNCTRDALATSIVTLLPQATTVLEILEDIEPDPVFIESCRALKALGYRFALDDFSPSDSRGPLLEFADFIKVDFRASDAATRKQIYRLAAECGAQLVAEKIETTADMELARLEGCRYFQGYFISRPLLVSVRVIPQNQLIYLRILAVLNDGNPKTAELEELIMSEPSICFRLLRLVNSARYGAASSITSIRGALLLAGENELRKLVTVALAGVLAIGQSRTLVIMALERAKFCELLAPYLRRSASQLYLLGMLSLIDVILQVPMAQVIDLLPIEKDMKAALLGEENRFFSILNLVVSYEVGDWQMCEEYQAALGIADVALPNLYVKSVAWTEKMLES